MKIHGAICIKSKEDLDIAIKYLHIMIDFDIEFTNATIIDEIKNNDKYFVSYSNGDCWIIYTNAAQCLGTRHNIVYFDDRISEDSVRKYIRPLANLGLRICMPIWLERESYLNKKDREWHDLYNEVIKLNENGQSLDSFYKT